MAWRAASTSPRRRGSTPSTWRGDGVLSRDTRHLRHAYAIDAPQSQVWEEVEAAARTEIGAKKLKRLGEPKRTARKKWRAPNLQEEVEDMALVFRDLEEDFDKMRRRQHELGVSHGPVCQVSETVEVSRVPAVLRDAALADLFHEVCLRHQARGGGKGPQLRKKNGVQIGVPREFTLDDANKILGLHNTKVKVKTLVPDDLVDPHCLASKKSLMMLYTAFLPEKTLMETVTDCVEINQCAIEQASRRWRGGRSTNAP